MPWYSPELIAALPKTDLHVHLDGSLRLSTLLELAEIRKVDLPADTESGLRETVFKDAYRNLEEYLRGFAYTCAVLQEESSLERVAYELLEDGAAEGVRYMEVRFAPQLHMSETLSFEQVVGAVDRGLRRCRDRLNRNLPEGEPEYEYGIILCAMRYFTPGFSRYYRDFCRMHAYSSEIEVIRAASLELARMTVKVRDTTDFQIVGFDLAGSEYGYPASSHTESYDWVHRHFLSKTVHAGEAYGPQSIFQALTRLHADRIGHGLHLFDRSLLTPEDAPDPEKYVRALVKHIADHRITLEVCLSSNRQTIPELADLKNHSLGKMLENRLSVTLCTDNRLVSHTTVTREYILALENFPVDPGLLKSLLIYGFKRSFYYGSYTRKRAWVRDVLSLQQRVMADFGIRG